MVLANHRISHFLEPPEPTFRVCNLEGWHGARRPTTLTPCQCVEIARPRNRKIGLLAPETQWVVHDSYSFLPPHPIHFPPPHFPRGTIPWVRVSCWHFWRGTNVCLTGPPPQCTFPHSTAPDQASVTQQRFETTMVSLPTGLRHRSRRHGSTAQGLVPPGPSQPAGCLLIPRQQTQHGILLPASRCRGLPSDGSDGGERN